MGMTVTEADEIKNRLNSTYVCCHSELSLFWFCFQKGKKKKIMTIILAIVLLECFKV
jgi:hypothetical protein